MQRLGTLFVQFSAHRYKHKHLTSIPSGCTCREFGSRTQVTMSSSGHYKLLVLERWGVSKIMTSYVCFFTAEKKSFERACASSLTRINYPATFGKRTLETGGVAVHLAL